MSLKTKQHFIYDQPYQLIIDIVTTHGTTETSLCPLHTF